MLLTFLQRLAWARGRWWAPHAMVKKYRCRVRPLACRRRTDERRTIMEAKPRLILALLMSSVIVCMVTLLVTFLDLGLGSDFLLQWTKAYFVPWPIAASSAFVTMPPARRLADRIVALINGRRCAACAWRFPQLRCPQRRWREPRPRDRQGSGLRSWSATYYSTSPAALFRSPRLEY